MEVCNKRLYAYISVKITLFTLKQHLLPQSFEISTYFNNFRTKTFDSLNDTCFVNHLTSIQQGMTAIVVKATYNFNGGDFALKITKQHSTWVLTFINMIFGAILSPTTETKILPLTLNFQHNFQGQCWRHGQRGEDTDEAAAQPHR